MFSLRRRTLIATALTATLVAGISVPLSAQPAQAVADDGLRHSTYIDPESTIKTFTVPEAIDGELEITVVGARGRGDAGGIGASFTFSTTQLPAGTVLEARFGPSRDATFGASAAGAGGSGGNADHDGTAGGDATLLLRRGGAETCPTDAANLLAVAGGGGGASGAIGSKRISDGGFFSSPEYVAVRAAGEAATRWDTGDAAARHAACRSGAPASTGTSADSHWYSRKAGGGGGGGGLTAGRGGTDTHATGATEKVKLGSFPFGTGRTVDMPVIAPATGGQGGTSYLSAEMCGDGCTLPEIRNEMTEAHVVIVWRERGRTDFAMSASYNGNVMNISSTLSGRLRGVRDIPVTGTVSAWIGDRRIATSTVGADAQWRLEVLPSLSTESPTTLRLEFAPDDTKLLRPISEDLQVIARRAPASFTFFSPNRTDNRAILRSVMSVSAPNLSATAPEVELLTRVPGTTAWTSRGMITHPFTNGNACVPIDLQTDRPLEVILRYAGEGWVLPTETRPFTFVPTPGLPLVPDMCGDPMPVDARDSLARIAPQDDAASSLRAAPASAGETTVTWVSPTSAAAGDAAPLAVRVASAEGELSEGIVEFLIDDALVGEASADADGVFRLAGPALGGGSYALRARYADPSDGTDAASHGSSEAQPVQLTVAPDAVTLDLSIRHDDAPLVDESVDLTASVTADRSGAGPVEGTVTFYDDDRMLAAVPLADGVARLDRVMLDETTNTVRAAFDGDPVRYATATTATPFAYTPAGVDIDLQVPSHLVADAAGELTVTVRGTSRLGTPLAPPVLHDGDGELAAFAGTPDDVLDDGTVVWRMPLSSLPVGTTALRAELAESTGFAAATSPARTVEVAARATSIDARRQGATLHLSAVADQRGITSDAVDAQPWGVARIEVEDAGIVEVPLTGSSVSLPIAADARLGAVTFVPLSDDLTPSRTAVRDDLAATGGEPPMSLALGAMLLLGLGVAATAVVPLRRRLALRR